MSMRVFFIFLLLCSYVGTLYAQQQQPQFIMPIWFEDSRGNRDTIWVGGDPSASSRDINPQFGEVAITRPFDSVFEVRAVHVDDPDWQTSKIIIEYNDSPGQCHLPPPTWIMMHVKYPPVRISWDTMILATNYPCNINIILTPDQFVSLLEKWYEARIIHCMMTREQIEISDLFPIPPPGQIEHPFEVEGEGMKVLPGLWFTGFWDYPHCYTTLSASEVNWDKQIILSSNPVSNYLGLSNRTGLGVRVLRAIRPDGRMVYSYAGMDMDDWILISTQEWESGVYFIQTLLENGNMVTKKVIKD